MFCRCTILLLAKWTRLKSSMYVYGSDAGLNMTAGIHDVFQHTYAQGESRKKASVHAAEGLHGNVVLLVDRDGFDAEEGKWESLRKLHSSTPETALKKRHKLRLTWVFTEKVASGYGPPL